MEKLPQFVASRLGKPQDSAESHPDADLLTAFAEQSLAGAERASVMEHLARCGDCRDVIAIALPAMEIAPVPAATIGSSFGWLRWPVLSWAALAAGLIAVASIGVVQYQTRHNEKLASTVPPQETTATSIGARDQSASTEISKQVSEQAPKLDSHVTTQEPVAAVIASSRQHRSLSTARQPEAERMRIAGSAQPGEVSGATNTESSTLADKNEIAQNQIGLPIASRSGTDLDVVKAKNAVSVRQLASPAPQSSEDVTARPWPQWSVTNAGVLQRSFDEGKTWELVNPAAIANPNLLFRVVAAFGPEVWAGGFGGALYHTPDAGNRWIRVAPTAAGAVLTGDITSIQFPDPQHGTIATSTAELWSTSDNGASWQKLK